MKYTRKQLDRQKIYNSRWYEKNRDKVNERTKEYQRQVRRDVIKHYGGECECCGEKEMAFLAIDHIGGGGYEHRKIIGSGSRFYMWLKKKGYPDGFRVLCHNCNQASSWGRKCPHELISK